MKKIPQNGFFSLQQISSQNRPKLFMKLSQYVEKMDRHLISYHICRMYLCAMYNVERYTFHQKKISYNEHIDFFRLPIPIFIIYFSTICRIICCFVISALFIDSSSIDSELCFFLFLNLARMNQHEHKIH